MESDETGLKAGPAGAWLGEERCLADKLGVWLRLAHRAFTDRINADFRRDRVTQLDFLVLSLISDHPGCRQTTIAQRLDIKAPNLAVALDYLIQRGLVSKTPDPIDRRANHLALTGSGAVLLRQLEFRYGEVAVGFFPGRDGERTARMALRILKQISRSPYADGPSVLTEVFDRPAPAPGERRLD